MSRGIHGIRGPKLNRDWQGLRVRPLRRAENQLCKVPAGTEGTVRSYHSTGIAFEAAHKLLELSKALEESVKLQAHYAELLNMHDGGERISFRSPGEWIARLYEIGDLQR